MAATISRKLLSFAEASRRTALSVSTLRTWARVGRLDSFKLGGRRLLSLEDLDRFIEQAKQPRKEIA